MNSLKKYPIIIITILVLSNFLPYFYDMALSKRGDYVKVGFSPVTETFIKTTYPAGASRKAIYSTMNDKTTFTREKFEEFFPFTYFSDLIRWGTFPEKLASFENNTSVIMSSKQRLYFIHRLIAKKEVGLYPLFESQSKFSGLELPEEFFRFNNKMEFINTTTNKIEPKQTKLFTKALKEKGFSFPMKKIFGQPVTRKPFDEGYFIVDNNNKFFHLKKQEGQPFIKEIKTNGIDIKYMLVDENSRMEFYGLVLGENKRTYLLMYDDYEFVELPIDNFDYTTDRLYVSTNPLYRYIDVDSNLEDKEVTTNYVTNLDYELVAKNSLEFPYEKESFFKKLEESIFPFQFYFSKKGSYFYYPKISNINEKAFIFNLLIVLLYLVYIKYSSRRISEHIINSILILSAGIYALIAIFTFARLLYFRKKI